MVKHVRHQKESSSSNDFDSEEMTSIDILPQQPPQSLQLSKNHASRQTSITSSVPIDRSTLEDQATPNPSYKYDNEHYHQHRHSSGGGLYANTSGSSANHPEYSKQAKVQPVLQMLSSKFFISCLILAALFITLLCIGLVVVYEKENDVTHSIDAWNDQLSDEQTVWFNDGLDDLKAALQTKLNTRRAKNVVLFVGDGMGPNTVTATRVYEKGEDGRLAWEEFPHMGMLKTYCFDRMVPDSAVTATALFGGVKANYETSGVDSAVPLGQCEPSLNKANQVDSILQWAQDEGRATGFVTTTRVVHATPAALYAHAPDRRWECDSKLPAEARQHGCKDIARQLIEDTPGRNLNVIMGGGRQCLVADVVDGADDPVDRWSCRRQDGRDLMREWRTEREAHSDKYAVVQNRGELRAMDTDDVEFVLGIFANGHLRYEHERDNGTAGMPTLMEMTEAAVEVLAKEKKGFVLVVESGLIDQAHHRGWARRAIAETAAMEAAVQRTMELLKDERDETLIIVTADHTHTLSINGYPRRGDNIFGIAQPSKADAVPYTTLTYATGAAAAFQVDAVAAADGTTSAKRRDPSADGSDTTAYDYVQQVAIATDENTHGGGDVTIHAIGPMAHLFHRVHEQSYVAHVISYAARIGRFRDNQMVQSFLDMLGIS